MRIAHIIGWASALLLAGSAAAQQQAPVYKDRNGNYQGAQGVIVLRSDGTAVDGTADQAPQTQGTAANGSPATGNPVLVAGWDGTNARTIRTTAVGAVVTAGGTPVSDAIAGTTATGTYDLTGTTRPLGAATMLFNGGAFSFARTAATADGTVGSGLLGAGILGQYQSTLPTYTAGQFGTLAMSQRGVLYSGIIPAPGVVLADGAGNSVNAMTDGGGTVVRQLVFPYVFNGIAWDRARGDTNGAYTIDKGGANMATGQISVGTTATLVAAARTGRQKITMSVGSATACAFGNPGVTLTTGFPLQPVAGATLTLDTAAAVYAVCSATATVSDVELF